MTLLTILLVLRYRELRNNAVVQLSCSAKTFSETSDFVVTTKLYVTVPLFYHHGLEAFHPVICEAEQLLQRGGLASIYDVELYLLYLGQVSLPLLPVRLKLKGYRTIQGLTTYTIFLHVKSLYAAPKCRSILPPLQIAITPSYLIALFHRSRMNQVPNGRDVSDQIFK